MVRTLAQIAVDEVMAGFIEGTITLYSGAAPAHPEDDVYDAEEAIDKVINANLQLSGGKVLNTHNDDELYFVKRFMDINQIPFHEYKGDLRVHPSFYNVAKAAVTGWRAACRGTL